MINTNKLLSNIDIQDVVERYTGKRIRYGKTQCPFHDDHVASLSVKTDKGIWKCWACDKGGNAINFVRELYGLSFIDACKKLSEDFNVDDIGLWGDSDTSNDIWAVVEAECRQKRQQELRQVRADINNQIDTLTAVHRCLFHMGYYKEAERYANELDRLQESLTYWK